MKRIYLKRKKLRKPVLRISITYKVAERMRKGRGRGKAGKSGEYQEVKAFEGHEGQNEKKGGKRVESCSQFENSSFPPVFKTLFKNNSNAYIIVFSRASKPSSDVFLQPPPRCLSGGHSLLLFFKELVSFRESERTYTLCFIY